ncbi:KN motif and ankyrin repeat domain-containing protein 3 [Schistocerca serialis cubense]|uniref:KN motif and ankyrin repeat domain-containing protein 3 n=1 Tax=Schistocerca serialis cubense TaxID=2023355 RepID=UPI00214EED8F|nr:KN motif and ankyrin repeat domain-containing protein 3 [Schistocerca serialis cubense]
MSVCVGEDPGTESRGRSRYRKCDCCPYGYHIDLDFVRYCEAMRRGGTSRPRRPRRRHRHSLEVLLGLEPQAANSDDAAASKQQSVVTGDLQHAVDLFEDALQKTSNSHHVTDGLMNGDISDEVDGLAACRTDFEARSPNSVASATSPNGLSTGALQTIREQMAVSLERMRELEEQVKLIPILQVQLNVLKEEKRKLLAEADRERQRPQPVAGDGGKAVAAVRHRAVGCAVVTRDVGVCSRMPRTRDAATSPAASARAARAADVACATDGRIYSEDDLQRRLHEQLLRQERELEDRFAVQLQSRLSEELQSKVSREFDEAVTRELRNKISRELDARVEAEFEKRVLRALDDKVSLELEGRVRRDFEDRVANRLDQRLHSELDFTVAREFDRKVSTELQQRLSRDLEQTVRYRLEDAVSQELERRLARDLEDRVSRELDDRVTRELQIRLSDELQDRVAREMDARVRLELQEKLRHDLEDRVTREFEDRVSREVEERISREMEDLVSREFEDRVARTLEDRISHEMEERVSREFNIRVSEEVEERVSREVEERVSREVNERVSREVEVMVSRELEERVAAKMRERIREELEGMSSPLRQKIYLSKVDDDTPQQAVAEDHRPEQCRCFENVSVSTNAVQKCDLGVQVRDNSFQRHVATQSERNWWLRDAGMQAEVRQRDASLQCEPKMWAKDALSQTAIPRKEMSVQATLAVRTFEIGVCAKPSSGDAWVEAKPTTADVGCTAVSRLQHKPGFVSLEDLDAVRPVSSATQTDNAAVTREMATSTVERKLADASAQCRLNDEAPPPSPRDPSPQPVGLSRIPRPTVTTRPADGTKSPRLGASQLTLPTLRSNSVKKIVTQELTSYSTRSTTVAASRATSGNAIQVRSKSSDPAPRLKRQNTYTKIDDNGERFETERTSSTNAHESVRSPLSLEERETWMGSYQLARTQTSDASSNLGNVENLERLERPNRVEPSKEMKAALKVINDSLTKPSAKKDLPHHLSNAANIVQKEWFRISGGKNVDPLAVEDYLDYIEGYSSQLLEYVVNMTDMSGNTALHYAVSSGNFDVVSILLDSKVCDINKPNTAGYTCVMLATLVKLRNETHRQIIRRMFHLADVNIKAKPHGQTALMLATSHGNLEMVEMLTEAGADMNIQDADGSTALMCAADHGYTDIVKHIISQPDCDVTIVDSDGNSALNIAMEAGNRHIGLLLYAHEHFSRSGSPHGSLRLKRSRSSTPTSRGTVTPSSPLMTRDGLDKSSS